MPRKLFIALLLCLTLAAGFWAGHMSAAQPHMLSARDHLKAAYHQLDVADPDKGGHRMTAMKLVKDAITEVNAGIGYAE